MLKYIARINAVLIGKDMIVIYRKNKTILINKFETLLFAS